MNIGEKIRQLRVNMGLTQEELAIAANTTRQTIHKYELGIISNIPASKIKAIADRLNTTPGYLMGWEENSEVNDNLVAKKHSSASDVHDKLDGLSPEARKKAEEYIEMLQTLEDVQSDKMVDFKKKA